MPVVDPKNLGAKVSTRTTYWADLVHKAWGSEFFAPDHKIYQFSGGNNKDSTDMGLTGIYGVRGDNLMVLEGMPYPDMRDGMQLDLGTPDGSANNGYGTFKEVTTDSLP